MYIISNNSIYIEKTFYLIKELVIIYVLCHFFIIIIIINASCICCTKYLQTCNLVDLLLMLK